MGPEPKWAEDKGRVEADLARHELSIQNTQKDLQDRDRTLHERINGVQEAVSTLDTRCAREFGTLGAKMETVIEEVKNGHGTKKTWIEFWGNIAKALIGAGVTVLVLLLTYFLQR